MKTRYITSVLIAFLLTGCEFSGSQEVYHPMPQMTRTQKAEAEIAIVLQGDLADEKILTALAQPAQQSSLSFAVTGEKIEGFYVSVGDKVRKGQILAELSCEAYLQELQQTQYELERVRIQKSQQKGLFDQYAMSKAEYERSMADLENKELYLTQKKSELDAYLQERRIVADMDGTVKRMTDVDFSALSEDGREMIVLVGGETTFTAKTADIAGLTKGTHYFMETKTQSYEVELLDMEQTDDGQYKLTFSFPYNDYDAGSGGSGKIIYTAHEVKDVLYVDQRAVSKVGDTYYVYYMEDGYRQAKQVVAGPLVSNYYVIEKGVSKGDELLCD